MKAALITGACINTGVAIVERFASEGRNVVFTGRRPDAIAEAEASKYRFIERPSLTGCFYLITKAHILQDFSQRKPQVWFY